jgi:hypothetical protein
MSVKARDYAMEARLQLVLDWPDPCFAIAKLRRNRLSYSHTMTMFVR